jgi:hypothetical protein
MRMRVDRHVARPQFAARHVQQAVVQQGAADAGAVAVRAHQAEHQRAEAVEARQLVAAEGHHLIRLDHDEERAVRLVQRGAQPGFLGGRKMVRHIAAESRQHRLAVGGAIASDLEWHLQLNPK